MSLAAAERARQVIARKDDLMALYREICADRDARREPGLAWHKRAEAAAAIGRAVALLNEAVDLLDEAAQWDEALAKNERLGA